jgi:HNH endonuclease
VKQTLEQRFWSYIQKTDTCWLWTGGKFRSGYGQIGTCEKPNRTLRAHRYSWELHFGPIPSGQILLHSCDNPLCVNPGHMSLGTHRDNIKDAIKKRRWNADRVFSHEEVRQIRALYESQKCWPRNVSRPHSLQNLANQFHVTKGAIAAIVQRRTYKNI